MAIDPGAMGLGAIFNHGDAVGAGQIADRGHVGRPAAQVHHRDGFGKGGDQGSNGGWGDGAGIGIHIGEHGLGSQQHSAGGCGDEGARGGDQLITLP